MVSHKTQTKSLKKCTSCVKKAEPRGSNNSSMVLKMFYYRGVKEWDKEKGYLTDTCLTEQYKYKGYLDYFRIR